MYSAKEFFYERGNLVFDTDGIVVCIKYLGFSKNWHTDLTIQ